jgi:hypothetical protein
MKKFFLLLMLVLTIVSPALAQQSNPNERFGGWMTYYYKDKDSSQMGDFMKWLQTSQMLERNTKAIFPTAAFLSVIFADNPAKVTGWLKANNFNGNAKKAIETALWLNGDAETLKQFATKPENYARPAPTKLSHAPVASAAQLDVMWGAFFASGDPVYVKKVIGALESTDQMTQVAAQWSLGSNMKQHELVKQTVQSEAKIRNGKVKQKLDELLAKASSPSKPQ